MPEYSEAYKKAIRSIDRLEEVKGEIKNGDAFSMLCDHFLHGKDIDELVEIHTPPGGDPSYTRRILSPHEGKDSSRRKDVRRIFRRFMLESGEPDPFTDYTPPPEKLHKPQKKRTLFQLSED